MSRRSSPVIIGRESELAEIEGARAAAFAGRPQIVIVRGEAGIGKSRLVDEALERARSAGDAILHGTCLDLDEDGLPYLPVIAALRGLGRAIPPDDFDALLGTAAGDLAALLPEVRHQAPRARRRDGRPPERQAAGAADDETAADAASADDAHPDGHPDGDPDARPPVTAASGVDRARLFERFLGFLGRLTERSPVFAVIEDVHWIDPATRALITFLVRNVSTERLVAVLTCRTDDLPPSHPVAAWLAELGRVPGAVRVDLGRLTSRDLARQLEAIAEAPVEPAIAQAIWRRSQGHPLFAEELLAAREGGAGDAAPPSLVDILLARVTALDPTALAVVRALAIAGHPIDERLLELVVERSPAEVGEALRAATSAGVLVALPDGRYGFRHELLREVVEHELTGGERRTLHERLAEALEANANLRESAQADAASDLARHWFAADRPVEAHRAAVAAAAAAETVHAFADAQRLLERAMALEGSLPPSARPTEREQIDIRRRASTVADLAGDIPRAIELIHQAIAICDETSEPTTAGLLHARLGYLTWASGDGEAALREHERAVELVPEDPPTTARANVLGGLAGALMGLGRLDESKPVAQAAIACAIAASAPIEESRARMTLGSDLVATGDVDAGLAELRRAHQLAGGPPTELRVVTGHNLALNLLAADRLDEALEVVAGAREAARSGGLERRYGMDLAALEADILFRLGRWEAADAATVAGLQLDQAGRGTPYLAIVRARLLAHRGRLDEAQRRLGAIDASRLDPDLGVVHAVALVEAALLADDPATAARLASDAVDRYDGTGTEVWAIPLLAHGLRAIGDGIESARAARDGAAAAPLLKSAGDLRRRGQPLLGQARRPTVAAWIATAEAEQSRVDGVLEPAPWAAAVAAWDAAGNPAAAAYARFRLAETELRRTGVKADVGAALETAWRATVELGAGPLREQIETLARRARVPLAAGATAGAAGASADAEHDAPSSAPRDGTDGDSVPVGAVARAAVRAGSDPHRTPKAPAHRLSAREIEVLRLVAAGRSNGEIGDELFITRKTAGVHVTHILDKLGVSNRVEAAMAAARLGLIDDLEASSPASADRRTTVG